MKTWDELVDIPGTGVCSVKEVDDKDYPKVLKKWPMAAPRSHGFVNLFQNGKWIKWCGVSYAKKYIIDDRNLTTKQATSEKRDPHDYVWKFVDGTECRLSKLTHDQTLQALMELMDLGRTSRYQLMTVLSYLESFEGKGKA